MKKVFFAFITTCLVIVSIQAQVEPTEINKRNSWLKFGINLGVPVSTVADISSFVGGIEFKGQLMDTEHVGIGLTTGYNHFFVEENLQSFGTVPLGGFLRLYPQRSGFFAGIDLGYSLVTGIKNADGGYYLKPQLGYHNYKWNVFGFYNHIFRNDGNGGNIAHLGIGSTINIHFK